MLVTTQVPVVTGQNVASPTGSGEAANWKTVRGDLVTESGQSGYCGTRAICFQKALSFCQLLD